MLKNIEKTNHAICWEMCELQRKYFKKRKIKHKTIFSVLLTLPMLIPSVSHGMGLILLFGSNGFITNLFNNT